MRGLVARRRFMRDHAWSGARLSDYLDGDLRPGETTRLEAHVHRCPECRRILATLRRTVEGLVALRTVAPEGVAAGVIDRLRREG